jgi:hypothetical protein
LRPSREPLAGGRLLDESMASASREFGADR